MLHPRSLKMVAAAALIIAWPLSVGAVAQGSPAGRCSNFTPRANLSHCNLTAPIWSVGTSPTPTSPERT